MPSTASDSIYSPFQQPLLIARLNKLTCITSFTQGHFWQSCHIFLFITDRWDDPPLGWGGGWSNGLLTLLFITVFSWHWWDFLYSELLHFRKTISLICLIFPYLLTLRLQWILPQNIVVPVLDFFSTVHPSNNSYSLIKVVTEILFHRTEKSKSISLPFVIWAALSIRFGGSSLPAYVQCDELHFYRKVDHHLCSTKGHITYSKWETMHNHNSQLVQRSGWPQLLSLFRGERGWTWKSIPESDVLQRQHLWACSLITKLVTKDKFNYWQSACNSLMNDGIQEVVKLKLLDLHDLTTLAFYGRKFAWQTSVNLI